MRTANYAVIGNPIGHSKSPEIHAAFAAQTGQDMAYTRLLAPLDGFAACVRRFIADGASGANVTVPFKLEACALATRLSGRARAAGAVNTLRFEAGGGPEGGGAIFGDNTDGVGLVADIVKNAGVALAGRRILLLGAGGAARGVLLPLLEQLPESVVVANRTPATAQEWVRRFRADQEPFFGGGAGGVRLEACGFEGLSGRFDVVINATSASLESQMPPLADGLFAFGGLAYEMVYGKEPSPFMRFAAAQGAQARDGLGMLVEQAAEAFLIWRGVRPDTAPVFAQLRAAL